MINEFDISSFGAVGDGKTDCTAAIQAALDAAAPVEGCVRVPSGAFLCGELRVPAAVTLEGTHNWSFGTLGGSRLVLRSASERCLLNLNAAFGSTIKGLSLDGCSLGERIHGIFVSRDSYNGGGREDSFRLEDCKISYFTGDGIHLDRIWCFTVRHCMSGMNRGAGLFVNGWDGFILDNWLTANGMGGLYSDEVCSSITMTGNRVEWNDHAGVDLRASKCCSFTGNYFDRSHGPAISIRGRAGDDVSDTISITGNVFNRNGGGDLQEKAPEDPMDDAHIRLERCVNCVVTGNVCRAGMNDGPGRLSPAYAFAIRQLRACIIRDNTVQSGMTVDTLLDRGEHENDVVVRDNLGQPTKTLDPWYPRFEKDRQ